LVRKMSFGFSPTWRVMMNAIDFPFQAIDKLVFKPRPQPLPANLRPLYRIALITLILSINCRGSAATLIKLQFFNWLLKSPSLQELIEERLTCQSVFTLELIHLDPMVNLALNYAFACNLISITSNSNKNPRYKLTNRGQEFVNMIIQDEQSAMAKEREFLERIGQRITEVKLKSELQ
jgi:hypothetical protein